MTKFWAWITDPLNLTYSWRWPAASVSSDAMSSRHGFWEFGSAGRGVTDCHRRPGTAINARDNAVVGPAGGFPVEVGRLA